ncbi:2-succinyl-6-hydroxy-2,4-cyclohexadiene-1-carboxylate synthase [Gallibacterium genomosp. 3]|uniref:Putative 2-succinyl-6-hydroxy-2,4-cyclohexadiene-1-carboxylate synthase n=1 Tax=Gallibacterium genomosp. 3 TaxID=505345 RepID=A0A1A7PQI9_9PAST|nr:2-succinyl-6-hydroxy-2,4-cyclohexadiene-1-carboxylate synthase [Gallibacterium genomosp. 3]OBX04016.1 2-succinyl-6-hydroxy-2,4-cyclohexadiene-1-carboxylate synthase [Gallibacterium genomosp. 3]
MQHLIFLHGFLGSQQDWHAVVTQLSNVQCHCLDLPGHGANHHIQISDFAESAIWLSKQIQQLVGQAPYYLIGYSLGGRLAAYFATQTITPVHNLQKVVLEGANLGLTSQIERELRWQNDTMWAEQLATQPIRQVLQAWYQQPVFADLTEPQRQDLINIRANNQPTALSQMLLATSLAKQPDLWQQIQVQPEKFYYFCGANDEKFRQLAEKHQLNLTLIEKVGHNAHVHQPIAFATKLAALFC